MPRSPLLRTALVRAGQIALTTALFTILNEVGSQFEIGNNVSILKNRRQPATSNQFTRRYRGAKAS